MIARLFALVIGIDHYQSGRIWDLNSCAEDAKRIRRFLVDDLNIPRDQICLLLDRQATKRAIEDTIMTHLVNNAAIERGDAILIYFAGHGSVIPAPKGWFQGDAYSVTGNVEVLCPYDHDMKLLGGRVAGISDRSMHALIRELAQSKGDNITFIADCAFSPLASRKNAVDRSTTRWTPTSKAKPDDLYMGLWPGARGKPESRGLGFHTAHSDTHVFLAACSPGDKAVEGKGGGRFTHALLEAAAAVSLHRTSYSLLFDRIAQNAELEDQRPVCLGKHKNRVVFDGTPFLVDARYVPVSLGDDTRPRLEVGAIMGIVEGSEFSLHLHNHRASMNPSIATVVISEVHPTWCIGRIKSSTQSLPRACWARITRWNNRRPFRVHLKATLASLCRVWKLRRGLSTRPNGTPSRGGLNVIRVKDARQADISMVVGRRNVSLKAYDDGDINARRVVKVERRDPLEVIDDAARFNLHLHRKHPDTPLDGRVSMELYRLDPTSWKRTDENLLRDGKATIPYEKGAIFSVIIRNTTDMDLWPYLFYMDPNSFGITKVYDPELSIRVPPLPRRSYLEIGSGKRGSEALSFALSEQHDLDSGFLKLFLAPKLIFLDMIEQGNTIPGDASPVLAKDAFGAPDQIWDALSACVQFVRR
ncbi:hypothetical protein DXG03_001411 [Asterophora parasitica]|uniref:Peptidase C14 caspase domain-containing protein n=1 Tax=Asterophora parasitica TaxID=117018 RepID=A0A9P7KGP2_9AGAR|nr:hypothetical protein DXG03_001411 [Asterophora parasitica]